MQVNTITPVRDHQCPLCETPPGEPCQPKPEGDHLARYLDAYTAGQLTRAYMAMVVGELVVVDEHAPWVMSGDGTTWRAQLPDGRTAKIERLDDGASFLPTVHESAEDFAAGPVCDGLLPAANWVTEYTAGAR